ncbi:ArsR/SmtB family transcription factor [Streptomyces sp. NPDC021212]|uniref:ArsR/SmtB family transcription factor n=1 Tax=Streptomyces sp. NPDC021212 TaxID=3365118 RepID=UPI0037AFE041
MTDFVSTAQMFKALGHPLRLGIVRALAAEPETCACDFADVFGVSQPTVSQHLKVLREAGLVSTRRRGVQICYSVRPEVVPVLQELVDTLRAPNLAETV